MKSFKIISFFLLLILSANINAVFAQPVDDDTTVLYWEMGAGYGTHTEIKLGVNRPIARDKIISLAFNAYIKNYEDVPGDYTTGFTFLRDGIPDQYMFMLSALFGKVFPQSRNMRVCLKGGPSGGVVQSPVFIKTDRQGGMLSFGPKYYIVYDSKFVAGLVVNPVAEFVFSDHFGLGLGLNGSFNTYSSSLCFELNLLLGRLRASAD